MHLVKEKKILEKTSPNFLSLYREHLYTLCNVVILLFPFLKNAMYFLFYVFERKIGNAPNTTSKEKLTVFSIIILNDQLVNTGYEHNF